MIFSRYNKLSVFIKRHFRSLIPFLTLYKTFNILLAVSEMKIRRTACMSKPFIFRIDPCSSCNLRCASCSSYKGKTNEKRVMALDDFKIIINRIEKYALRTSLYDIGEPLLNKEIYKMIKYVSDRGISTLISTNFNLFKKEDLNALFDSHLTVLEPCLDGFTQENYVKYRRGGDVEVVKNGIQMVLKYKHENKLKWPIVDVQVVLFDHIKEEIPLIRDFLKQIHVDSVTYRQENLGFNSPETTIKGNVASGQGPCFWLYLGMAIGADGSVYPCCGQSTRRIPYGNILTQELDEIWNNKYYQFSRLLFSKGNDLDYNGEMSNVLCLTCDKFKRQRKMLKKFR